MNFTSVTPENSRGISCVIQEGPMVILQFHHRKITAKKCGGPPPLSPFCPLLPPPVYPPRRWNNGSKGGGEQTQVFSSELQNSYSSLGGLLRLWAQRCLRQCIMPIFAKTSSTISCLGFSIVFSSTIAIPSEPFPY